MSTPDNPRAKEQPTPRRAPRGGTSPDPAIEGTTPIVGSPGPSNPQQPNSVSTPRLSPAAASNSPASQWAVDTQKVHAGGGPDSQQPISRPTPNEPATAALTGPQQHRHDPRDTQMCTALLLWDPVLQTLADGLDDVEKTRIAQANRYRILTTRAEDSDGQTRGFGLAADHPAVAALDAQLQTLDFLDKQMAKALAKQLRTHPLHPWVKRQNGLGDKTVARLLATLHDPYWNDLHDRPRTIGELFAFCGVAGPGQRRTRGQRSNWSPDARKRLWIMTGPIIRGNGPYRAVYDAGRVKYAEKTHTAACAQCGAKGKPAEAGTPWRDGHKHAGAIRLVMREILRDLWTESRAIYDVKQEAA